jgi:4-cresol dehydrogenase (hydroxylating)
MLDVENLDSYRDRCSLLWICPSVALEGDVISTAMAKVEAIILSHDFEPNIGFNPISARAIEAYIGIMYDLDISSEYGRAIKCHDDVVDWLIFQGHLLFRLGTQSMGNLPLEVDRSIALFRRIKQAFDLEQIISA